MNYLAIFITLCLLQMLHTQNPIPSKPESYVLVLGTAQDGGYPQAGCQRTDCQKLLKAGKKGHYISCIAIVDEASRQSWMIDATPDFPEQLALLEKTTGTKLAGIFITHAHIGHYTGLMHLGREVMGAKQMPVYAMPKMKLFLEQNGPWSQLMQLQNIVIQPLVENNYIALTADIKIKPFVVPHRDEYSETVGYQIESNTKKVIFIPDINKWSVWDQDITKVIQNVNIALLDGTFYKNGEIPGRDMKEIPHPFVEESMDLFSNLSDFDKNKVYFIHLNHTNPLLHPHNQAQKTVRESGFHIASEGQKITL